MVEGPNQKLGQAEITTGFFTFWEDIDCYWADDKKQRAHSTYCKTIKGINDNLIPWIGGDPQVDHDKYYNEIDEFHGRISIEIYIWVAALATASLAAYLALAAVPDGTESMSEGFAFCGGLGASVCDVVVWEVPMTGWTFPWGRIGQAAALLVILAVMMSLGSAQYEIWGIPYDLAYLEKKSIAIEKDLKYWEENEKEVKNDFIGSWDQADTVAVTELIYQRSQSEQRTLVVGDDLRLEVGDIVQIPDGRRIFIEKLSKTIKRGEVPKLTINGFKVMVGR